MVVRSLLLLVLAVAAATAAAAADGCAAAAAVADDLLGNDALHQVWAQPVSCPLAQACDMVLVWGSACGCDVPWHLAAQYKYEGWCSEQRSPRSSKCSKPRVNLGGTR